MVVVDGHSLRNIEVDVCKFSVFSQFPSYSALLVLVTTSSPILRGWFYSSGPKVTHSDGI